MPYADEVDEPFVWPSPTTTMLDRFSSETIGTVKSDVRVGIHAVYAKTFSFVPLNDSRLLHAALLVVISKPTSTAVVVAGDRPRGIL